VKIVFLGTPEFAVPSLTALCENFEVVAVVCQPDRAKDRKGNLIFGAVKREAISRDIPVYQFEKINEEGADILRALAPDVMVTCAYGQILSQEILDIPPLGVINVHGSLLPALRGSSPIQWALIDGLKETGVSIMKTDVGMDTGDVLAAEKVSIGEDDYVEDLYAKLSQVGASLLIKTLKDYECGKITPIKQDESKATKCRMLTKDDAKIDFCASPNSIRNKIRGIGYGFFTYKGETYKVYRAFVSDDKATQGEIVSLDKHGLKVGCKDGSVIFTVIQAPGKKKMSALDFANGTKMSGRLKDD
jgi:methionyl-tRNA formyltransferase